MSGTKGLKSMPGTENNKVKIGKDNTLLGDPKLKIEKPYTIIGFPGGDVEISRTSDNNYWVHVAVRDGGEILDARVDCKGRYADDANDMLEVEIEKGDVEHIAFLLKGNNA